MNSIKSIFLIVITFTLLLPAVHRANDPVARSSAIVRSGDVRFTILTSQLIRMEWSKDKIFEDKASLVFMKRNLPVPQFKVDDKSEWLTIATDKLILRYRKNSGAFTSDNLSIGFFLNGKNVEWCLGMKDSLNLKGTTRTLDGTNGEKDVHLEDGLLSRSGWAVIDDSERLLFDGSEWNWATQRHEGERQDLYFFGYGHDYKKALYDFSQVAGKIPMPPRFAFGYWWSRYWTYSDNELQTLVNDMKSYDVPIDVLIIDMDWHDTFGLSGWSTKRDPFGQAVGWTGYTWNRNLFPNPEKFLQWIKQQNLKTALNLHPATGIAPMEEKYSGFAQSYGFDTTGRKYIPFAIEDKKWTKTYFDVVLHPIEKQGIDFWWLDWQAWLENKNMKGLSNTWWLNYTFFTEMERQGKVRPLLFHRWGGLGNHRYQIGFSGDTYITWESLAYQPYFTSTASNVAYGYWSHDIGGHMGGEPNSEMYLRWLQFGIFSPIVRTHSTKSSELERRIWKHTDYFEMMRDVLQFRYALVPYIYTASRKAYDTGISICRPMYYDYPEKQEAYDFKGQYMFGDEMLVAPVTEKIVEQVGLASKKIWLPEGHWYELFTGSMLKGGSVVERKFAINEIPFYVKAGAIIPMYPKRSHLQCIIDTLALTIIPGDNGETNIYEDDGTTSDYKNDQFAWTNVKKENQKEGGVKIIISPRKGFFKNISNTRAYELRLPSTFPPSEVTVNKKIYLYKPEIQSGSWFYNGATLTTHIITTMLPCVNKTEIVIRWDENYKEKEKILDGKIGLFNRFPKIIKMMKDEVNRRDAIANAPVLVLKAASLPTRIQYQPQKALQLLEEFDREYIDLIKQIMEYQRGDVKVLESIINQFPSVSQIVSQPNIMIEKTVSDQPMKVEMSCSDPAATIRYTLDGKIPDETTPVYSAPFFVSKTSNVVAKAFKPGFLPSFSSSIFFQSVFAKSVKYEFPNSSRYSGGGDFALVNGKFGTAEDYCSDYVGFQQVDCIATVELLKQKDISSINIRFLQNQESWIFLPTHVQYEVSNDGVNYRSVYDQDFMPEAEKKSDTVYVHSYSAKVMAQKITHLRVRAKNIGQCPSWHPGAGGRAWMFVDEIVVE